MHVIRSLHHQLRSIKHDLPSGSHNWFGNQGLHSGDLKPSRIPRQFKVLLLLFLASDPLVPEIPSESVSSLQKCKPEDELMLVVSAVQHKIRESSLEGVDEEHFDRILVSKRSGNIIVGF